MNKKEEEAVSIAINVLSALLSNGLQDKEVEFSVTELVKLKNKSVATKQKRNGNKSTDSRLN